ncbi:MAG: hypothetical protein ACKVQR_04790 [Aquabacterium sp.]
MALSGWLASCGGGGGGEESRAVPLSPQVQVFDADKSGWLPNNGRWYNYVQSEAPCLSGEGFPNNPISPASCFQWLTSEAGPQGAWIRSTGPWWIDPNHMQKPGGNGFGFVHVLAFTQLPAAVYSPASLDETVVEFSARIDAAFATLEADSLAGRRKGHVYFWFQTWPREVEGCTPNPETGENCTRQSDYILTGEFSPDYEIDRMTPGQEKRYRFRLSALDAAKWTCLGAGVNLKYDCEPLSSAIRNVAVVGFIIAPVPRCPYVTLPDESELCNLAEIARQPGAYLNLGTFEFRDFSITKALVRASEAFPLNISLPTQAAGPGWSRLYLGEARRYDAGNGLHIPITGPVVATRLGLTRSSAPADAESAGLHVYLLPAGFEPGQTENLLLVAGPTDDGRFERLYGFGSYKVGDTIGFLVDGPQLLVLKNDELIFQTSSPCVGQSTCILRPFVSTYGVPAGAPRILTY